MGITSRLAWRNLWRQPRRTWLTIGAMVFANMLLVFMISLQFATYSMMIDNTLQTFTGHMQVQAPGYLDDEKMRQTVPDVLPLAARLREEFPEADAAARALAYVLASSDDRSYGIAVYGVEPEFETSVSSVAGLVGEGRYLEKLDASEIVIGSVLARNLKVGVGDELTILGSGRDGSFAAAVLTIVGLFDSGITDIDRSISEMPLGTFQDVFSMQGSGHHVVIRAASVDAAAELLPALRNAVPPGLVLEDWDALQPGLRQMIAADMSSAFFMYGILVILVAFSVLNTQLMSVLERTREFGIVLALGVTPGRLGRLVILETAAMGLLGVVLGALAGGALTSWFSVHGFTVPGMEEMAQRFNLPPEMYPEVTPAGLFAGPVFVFVVSLLAATYPAWRLRRLEPVPAMRAA